MPDRDGMPGAVFINLDRAVERRRFMEEQAARLGLPLRRFAAVDAAAAAGRAELNNRWERPLEPAELACFLSHHGVWAEVAAGTEPVLVMEDDVVLSPRTTEAVARLAALSDADLVNLESFGRKRFVSAEARVLGDGLSVLRLHRDKAGAGAYLLWPAGARRLLAATAAKGAAPADAFIHSLRTLRAFQAEPALAMQAHVLAGRGLPVPLPVTSFVQLGRSRSTFAPRHLPFLARRAAAQLRLARHHFMRLFGRRRYRLVDVVEAEFDHSRS